MLGIIYCKLVVVDVAMPTADSRSAGRGSRASVVDSRGVGTSFRFSVCSQNHNNEHKLSRYREVRINREKSLKLPCHV